MTARLIRGESGITYTYPYSEKLFLALISFVGKSVLPTPQTLDHAVPMLMMREENVEQMKVTVMWMRSVQQD